MKGVIFTEFIEVVEENFGYEMINLIIEKVQDPEDGAYTSVRDYSHKNLVNLVVALHEETQTPLSELLIFFGTQLFQKLANRHPQVINSFNNSFDLLEKLDDVIHLEVKKLYPAAQPPKFIVNRPSDNELFMRYSSHRKMEDVAEGLMKGCFNYFKEDIEMYRSTDEEDSNIVIFKLVK